MMNRYMNGLLLSNVFWDNARVCSYFARDYLGSLPAGASLLEYSDRATACSSFSRRGAPIAGAVTGWDISETSVANTREALRAMTLDGAVDLAVRDWFAPDNGDTEQFDAIVLSENSRAPRRPGRGASSRRSPPQTRRHGLRERSREQPGAGSHLSREQPRACRGARRRGRFRNRRQRRLSDHRRHARPRPQTEARYFLRRGRTATFAMNLNPPHILGLGTCQLHNPIGHLDTQGEAISVLRRLRLSGDPYSFTPSEHLQTLRIMRGDVVAPRSILPFLPKHISNENRKRWRPPSLPPTLLLCEICNPVEILFDGWQLNICSVLGGICADAAKQDAETGDAARQWYYRGLMQGDDAIRADAAEKYLALYPERDEQSAGRREIVKYARVRRVDDDALEAEFRNLNAAIGKPTGIVTHIIRYMPDGRPISWPPDFRNRVIDLAGFSVEGSVARSMPTRIATRHRYSIDEGECNSLVL